jgi:gliding motility-associatede transport system auxiliary component
MRFARHHRLWLILPVLAAGYVLLVLGSSQWLQGKRIDLTRDHLYTLSPGTRRIIGSLHQPLDLTLYFSDRASRGLPQLRAYHERVVTMLEEIVRDAHGRVHLKQVDPLAFSEDEDRATAAGLTPVPGEGNGESIFFGLVGRNARDGRTSVIPFFLLAKEPFLEYDIARQIHDLSVAHKPRVAIFSELPIWGDADEGSAGAGGQPPWTALQQVRQLFDVQRLDTGSLANVDGKVSVLVLIQPRDLSDADTRAIDRYVQAGGRLLVFVDPDSEVDGGLSSDLPRLFRAWGIAFDPDRVLLDRARALRVQSPLTGEVRHPAVLGLSDGELNRHDPVTAALSVIDVSTVGHFGLLPGATTRLEPLIQSTTEAMAVPAQRVRDAGDPTTLYEGYRPDGEHYAIAVRLEGTLASAFDSGAHHGGAESPSGRVILVADTDLLADRLWVQESLSLGQTLVSPFANNGDFLANAIDDLSGPSDLIAIRGRAVTERQFTRVENLRRSADEKFKAKQLELQTELADTERRLAALKSPAHGKVRTAEQKAAVQQFMQRKLQIRGELRAVQRRLDADIESLSMQLRFIDILLMPILVILIALGYGGLRARRTRARRG